MEVATDPRISVRHPSFLTASTVAKLLVSVKRACGVSLSLLQDFEAERCSDHKGRGAVRERRSFAPSRF